MSALRSMGSRLATLLAAAALFAAYAGGALLGYTLSFPPDRIAVIWPPNAVVLAALLVSPPRRWPALLAAGVAAELAVDLPSGFPLAVALGFALANVVEVVLAAALLRRLRGEALRFDRVADVTALLGVATLAAPAVSATLAAAVSSALMPPATYAGAWVRWFVGDAVGHLALTPALVLLLRSGGRLREARRRALELAGLAAALAGTTWLAFSDAAGAEYARLYLPLPALLWAAVRFGPGGVAGAVAVLAIASIACTGNGLGPLAGAPPEEAVFSLQVFLAMTATPLLYLAAFDAERRDAVRALRRTLEGLEEAVRTRTADLERASRAADAANRAKGEFVARISHDLRSPLQVLLLQSDSLSHDREAPAGVAARAQRIRRTALHLRAVVNDVLDLAQLEAGRLQVRPEDVALEDLLAVPRDVGQVSAEAKGLAFECEVDPSLPARLRLDGVRVQQVLVNLVANAVKFTGAGRVRLSVTRTAQGRIRFVVEDTGAGIPPDGLERIFLPFEQGGAGDARTGGTGLGLAIGRHLVELLGGALSVQSEVGRGSTFWFELPVEAATARGDAAAS